MTKYNEYQKMHYKSLYGTKPKYDPSKDTRRYRLVHHTEICVENGTYQLCNGVKTKLLATGRYQKNLFKIELLQ